jgi:alkylated DNA nucleotide flippase Atl1
VSFTPKAFDLVHAATGGVPRMINLLCDRALMEACQKQVSRIAEEHVVPAAALLNMEIPRGKVRAELAAAAVAGTSRRTLAIGVVVLAIAVIGAAIYSLGNPLELFAAGAPPGVRTAPAKALPPAIAALPAPAGMPAVAPPPPQPGSVSILVGTYDSARQVQTVETVLREKQLPVYAIDIVMAAGDVQRRVLLGRYATREEADAARQKLGPLGIAARVIPGELERLRVIPVP